MLERKRATKKTGNRNLLLCHNNVPTHTSLKTTVFMTNNKRVIILHPPYSPDLASCDFALTSKLKMKLKVRHFETVSDIQMDCKHYLTAFKKMTSTVLFMSGKNDGIAVDIPKGIILKEMAAKIEYVKPAFLF
jgi:hypothetical protein